MHNRTVQALLSPTPTTTPTTSNPSVFDINAVGTPNTYAATKAAIKARLTANNARALDGIIANMVAQNAPGQTYWGQALTGLAFITQSNAHTIPVVRQRIVFLVAAVDALREMGYNFSNAFSYTQEMNNQVVRHSDAQRLVNINASRNIVAQGTAAANVLAYHKAMINIQTILSGYTPNMVKSGVPATQSTQSTPNNTNTNTTTPGGALPGTNDPSRDGSTIPGPNENWGSGQAGISLGKKAGLAAVGLGVVGLVGQFAGWWNIIPKTTKIKV
jgi:hypothetical protein